jgi:hypothetical protein
MFIQIGAEASFKTYRCSQSNSCLSGSPAERFWTGRVSSFAPVPSPVSWAATARERRPLCRFHRVRRNETHLQSPLYPALAGRSYRVQIGKEGRVTVRASAQSRNFPRSFRPRGPSQATVRSEEYASQLRPRLLCVPLPHALGRCDNECTRRKANRPVTSRACYEWTHHCHGLFQIPVAA